jgi:hypothetical protein
LTGIEEDQAVGVLDHVGVDRPGRRQLREPRIQAYIGTLLPNGCWGWIWVVPVLTTETRPIGRLSALVEGPSGGDIGIVVVMIFSI